MKYGKKLLLGVSALTVLTLSLVFALLDALIPLKIWTHPVLNFLFALCIGFGIMMLTMAFMKKSPWFFFLSAVLLGLALFYVLMQYITWWIVLIILVVVLAIFAVISFMTAGNETEDISLNKSPDYKNYEQRKAGEQAQDKEGEQPLPKIKSFKD